MNRAFDLGIETCLTMKYPTEEAGVRFYFMPPAPAGRRGHNTKSFIRDFVIVVYSFFATRVCHTI